MPIEWTLDRIVQKLSTLKGKGFIAIPERMHRHDEGIVGQLLEREFNLIENNLSIRDLGEFELKTARRTKKNRITLLHKSPDSGLRPTEIFNRFGYVKPSNRNKDVMKKKFFVTVTGLKHNKRGFILRPKNSTRLELFYQSEFICEWDLSEQIKKMDKIVLVLADTKGQVNARDEAFHYNEAWLLSGMKDLAELILSGIIDVDFCIDQVEGSPRGPHDRGPHIRIKYRRIRDAYENVTQLL